MIEIGHARDVAPRRYDDGSTARRVEKRLLIGPGQGAPGFAMRRFTIAAGGHTPRHSHPWEHEVYVLAGRGEARSPNGSTPVGPGDFVFVPPGDEHQFANPGDAPFEFLCIVPLEGDDG